MVERVPLGERLTLYFDGSCQHNRDVTSDTPAGWGLVVVRGDAGVGRGDGEVIEEHSGRVITDSEEVGWLGAEVGSNNTAELTALAHTLRWLLTEGGGAAVTLRGDSKYALNIASGAWRAKANRELAARVQMLWTEVSAFSPATIRSCCPAWPLPNISIFRCGATPEKTISNKRLSER